jgi:hypothetical protein
MKYLPTAAAAALALLAGSGLAARADVVLTNQLSGTGDNVVFDSLLGHMAIGSFNDQHTGVVDFTDLSNSSTFIGAANGNDIKIANTSDLLVQAFTSQGGTTMNTLTDVFSLKGTGTVTASVTAVTSTGVVEPVKTFNLGMIDPSAQSGFTFTAINGEQIVKFELSDAGGSIADFEHYRIDVAGPITQAVPGPVVGAGLPGLIGALGLWGLSKFRRRRRGIVSAG